MLRSRQHGCPWKRLLLSAWANFTTHTMTARHAMEVLDWRRVNIVPRSGIPIVKPVWICWKLTQRPKTVNLKPGTRLSLSIHNVSLLIHHPFRHGPTLEFIATTTYLYEGSLCWIRSAYSEISGLSVLWCATASSPSSLPRRAPSLEDIDRQAFPHFITPHWIQFSSGW